MSWSLIDKFGSVRAKVILCAGYRNGIPLAVSWRRRNDPDWAPARSRFNGTNSLSTYMARTGYHVPSAFGPNLTAKRLRAVKQMLEVRNGDYSTLTPVIKAKWTKALAHNEHDC